MDRDEFMELVYETFADEPDNVLANGIIEAADAYVEYEKAQLSQEGTTSDLISRQAAIDALSLGKEMLSRVLDDIDVVGTVREKYSWGLGLIESYINDINELPSAQPEPQEGHWIRRDCGLDVECKCSKCGYRDFVEPRDEYWFKRNYCPNCGAKMKGERQK